MSVRLPEGAARKGRFVRVAGALTIGAGLVSLVIGLILVESLFTDLSASFRVSQSAIEAISETIEVVEGSVSQIDESLDAASASLSSVATAAEIATRGLEDVAVFLDEDLPADVDAILVAMPAAIQTAEAIDTTLSALSFFGVDYDPEEPFDVSLRRVEDALDDMPADLRAQSQTIRALIPSVGELGEQTGRLAEAIDAIEGDLAEINTLVGSYRVTVEEAQTSIDETNSNLGEKAWLLRLMMVILALGGVVVGSALISLGRALDQLAQTPVVRYPDPALPRRSSTP